MRIPITGQDSFTQGNRSALTFKGHPEGQTRSLSAIGPLADLLHTQAHIGLQGES